MCKLIYFFGPDGTGKTTHADLIAASLKLMGFRVWRAKIKHHHTIVYLILKLMEKGNYNVQMINYYGFHEELTHKIRSVWKIIEIASFFIALMYRVYLPALLGYIVVCDRYVLDTIVTLSYFLKEPNFVLSTYAKVLVGLIPKNSFLFHLDADTNTIMFRKLDEPLTYELIEYYRRIYTLLLKAYSLKAEKIDTTTEAIQNIQKRITKLIGILDRPILT
ncbi:MAG: hypothetical protein QXR45_13990 [Candidatus Bathyarchaeia archaeon]